MKLQPGANDWKWGNSWPGSALQVCEAKQPEISVFSTSHQHFPKCQTTPVIQIPLSMSILPKHPFDFLTLEQSRVLSGLSPPLQISQRVVPKPHLSVAKLRFWGFSMHSGGTHGIRSTRTGKAHREGDAWVDETVETDSKENTPNQNYCITQVWGNTCNHLLTFLGQHSDTDTRVAEFDEGQVARRPILLSDKKNILGTNVSMNEVLLLLCADVIGK